MDETSHPLRYQWGLRCAWKGKEEWIVAGTVPHSSLNAKHHAGVKGFREICGGDLAL